MKKTNIILWVMWVMALFSVVCFAGTASAEELPSAYNNDIDNLKYVSGVEEQVGGTCELFSSCALLESCLMKQEPELVRSVWGTEIPDVSEYHIMHATSTGGGNVYGGRSTYTTGSSFDACVRYWTRSLSGLSGIVREDDDPLQDPGGERPVEETIQKGIDTGIYVTRTINAPDWDSDTEELDDYYRRLNRQIKQFVYTYGGAKAGFYWEETYYDSESNVYKAPKNVRPNHAIEIVGWDDEKGAFLCKNSWGTHRHDRGLFWLDYENKIIDVSTIAGFTTRDRLYSDLRYVYDSCDYISLSATGKPFQTEIEVRDGKRYGEQLNYVGFNTYFNRNQIRVLVDYDTTDNVPAQEVQLKNFPYGKDSYNIEWRGFVLAELETPVPLEENFEVLVQYREPIEMEDFVEVGSVEFDMFKAFTSPAELPERTQETPAPQATAEPEESGDPSPTPYVSVPTIQPPSILPSSVPGNTKPAETAEPEQTQTPEKKAVKRPQKVKGVTVKKKGKKGKKSVSVTWRKSDGADGYQVVFSRKKNFSGRKGKNVSGRILKISSLKKGKTYFFKVRAYKKDGAKKVYGSWSSVVKKKI